jgi:hypothetical protein
MATDPDCDNEIAKAAIGEDSQRATGNFGGPGMVNRIAEKLNSRQDHEENVHERLHNEAKTRMMNRHYLMEMGMMDDYGDVGSEFTSHTGGRGGQQHGSSQMSSPLGGECSQRLYYEGIRNMQARENEINEVKLVRRDLEDRNLTHKPDINKISNMIVSSKPRSKSVEQRLMMYGRARLDRQKVLQSVKYEQEVAECTFNPRVDPISTQIVNEKSRFMDDDVPHHEQLFRQSKVHNERMKYFEDAMNHRYPFQPQVNQYAAGSSQLLDMSFYTRLNYYEQEGDYKRTKLLNTYANSFGGYGTNFKDPMDPEGDYAPPELFHPRTGRSPANRNLNNMPVGMYLYEKAFINQRKKDILKEEHESEIKQKRLVKNTTLMSEKIVDSIKFKRLEEIFDLLDSDNDGVISNSKIDISRLPTEILKI